MRFVISEHDSLRELGIGKEVDPTHAPGEVHYFVSPAEPMTVRSVEPALLQAHKLGPEERVFFQDDDGRWRVGRLIRYMGPDQLHVRLPNRNDAIVELANAQVRSNLPMEQPLGLLQERTTETPYWHSQRHSLVRALAEQRSVYRGLVGVASASIDIFAHQVGVAQRVLSDPIPRYLLADEVGLGKTIEAGIVIRQHVLDEPCTAEVLVAVPDTLVNQWSEELQNRFQLQPSSRLRVIGHSGIEDCASSGTRPSLLVVDEAHDIAQTAFARGLDAQLFLHCRDLAKRAHGVLLLSATPILHNEDSFLAMLHLLDPASYPLSDRDGFRERVQHREAVSGAIRDLSNEMSFIVESALERLEPLCANDPVLADRVNAVRAVLDCLSESVARAAVAALRSHLQEAYRLDRRLLRTRRSQESVRDAMPRREYRRWEVTDPIREATFDWLDRWRFSAVDGSDGAQTSKQLRILLNAALCHPSVLRQRITDRRDELKSGAAPCFPDEVAILEDWPPSTSVAEDPRLSSLVTLITDDVPRKKWVVFVSEPRVAKDVATVLDRRVPKAIYLGSEKAAADAVAAFRTDSDVVALVCDRTGEQGLNLQGMRARLVHFDLPLSVNRIEQRIGRLDRIGGDRYVQSYVPSLVTDTSHYEAGWESCLVHSARVFERSVASLQHVLDAGHRRLLDRLLVDGVEAFEDLAAAWSDPKGSLSLEGELQRVEYQALLDQVESVDAGGAGLWDSIEEYEYVVEPKSRSQLFVSDLDRWLAGALQFKRRRMSDADSVIEYEYVLDGTLLSPYRMIAVLAKGFKKDRLRRVFHSGWMEFDRDNAQETAIPIARIGHPFVDAVRELMYLDERGRAYACWRSVPGYGSKFSGGGPVDLFFRFDFLVEADLSTVEEEIRRLQFSRGALARRVEEAFSTEYVTVWVDGSGDQVVDQALVSLLQEPYGDRGDRNIRLERWEPVDDLGLYANWPTVCENAHQGALAALQERIALPDRQRRAEAYLRSQFQHIKSLLEARLSAVPERRGDARTLELERAVLEILGEAVRCPAVRLDSVGAMFLADPDLG